MSSFWPRRLLHAVALVAALFPVATVALDRPPPGGVTASMAEQVPPEWRASMAALARGAPGEAVAHLERLVSEDPGNPAYRYALGRAYFVLKEDAKARFHFERALAGELTQTLAEAARTHIALIDARRVWTRRFTFAVAPESNVVRRTRARTVELGGLVWRLDNDARRRPGIGVQIGAGIAGAPPLGAGLRGEVALSARGTFYRERGYDDYALSGRAALAQTDGPARLAAGFRGELRWAGGRLARTEIGPVADFEFDLPRSRRLSLSAEAVRRHYPALPGRDGWHGEAAVGVREALSPRTVIRGEVRFGRTTADLPAEAGWSAGVLAGVTHVFAGGLIGGLDLELVREERDGRAPLFGTTRRDDTAILTGRFLHRSLRWRGNAPFAEIGLERRRSNIPIHDYNNARLAIGVTREF